MGLYKEFDYYLREKHKLVERIYDDACDMGIPVSGFDDPLCAELKDIFADRGTWKGFVSGIKRHRTETRYANGILESVAVIMYLPWEETDDGCKCRCTKWTVTYFNDPVRKKQFITLFAANALMEEENVWEE